MKTLKTVSALFVCALLVITACNKEDDPPEGPGGQATITGHVKHHDEHIPNAEVYIKYDAREQPGTEPSDYDDTMTASAGDGHYEFEGLQKGDYYLYSIGFDSAIFEVVVGGLPVKINNKSEVVEVDIQVTE